MADEDIRFEEFKGLVKELSDVKAKLLKLEERKNTVRQNVYGKVKTDYEAKLKEAEEKIEKKAGYIDEAFNSCRSEVEDLVKQRNSIEEEVEELSLRDYLGEFQEEEHERLYEEKKDLLGSLMEKLENSTSKIDFLKEFLPESLRETLSEEGVAVSHEETPAESVEAPVESVEVPTEPLETPIESLEAPAESPETPIESLEVPAESPETPIESLEVPTESEEAIEEKIPVEETAVETGESPAVEQPAEMLSAEEADKLIEEKIYPAEEPSGILKQPELGPEAKEKEGVECPKCGMVNEPDSWYCEKCGAELLAEGTG